MCINDDTSKIEEIICVCYDFFLHQAKQKQNKNKIELFAIKRSSPT